MRKLGLEFAILAFIVVVIGGMGSLPGSFFAASYWTIRLIYSLSCILIISAVNMLMMIIVLSIRPQGLF